MKNNIEKNLENVVLENICSTNLWKFLKKSYMVECLLRIVSSVRLQLCSKNLAAMYDFYHSAKRLYEQILPLAEHFTSGGGPLEGSFQLTTEVNKTEYL